MTNQTSRHRTIYAVPEYLVSKYIPEHLGKNVPKVNWVDAYGYATDRPGVSELAHLLDIKVFDIALPIDWVRDFQGRTGFNPVGHFVWSYDENSFGLAKAITREGIVALGIYTHMIQGGKYEPER